MRVKYLRKVMINCLNFHSEQFRHPFLREHNEFPALLGMVEC